MRSTFLACVISALLIGAASADSLNGQYLEARNASMWAGLCVVNSEFGIVGDTATLAWKVTKGAYQEVPLDGLAIVAVVFGDRTFGIGDKVNTQTIFIVDETASKRQQEALVKMATNLAGDTIQEVVTIKRAKIKMEIPDDGRSGYSFLDAGIARIRTRRLRPSDSLCGTKERMAYPVLARVRDEHAAYTLENCCSCSEVKVKMTDDRNAPSAVIASFSL